MEYTTLKVHRYVAFQFVIFTDSLRHPCMKRQGALNSLQDSSTENIMESGNLNER